MSFTYRNRITAEGLTSITPESTYSRHSLHRREHSPHSISKWLRADTALLDYGGLPFQAYCTFQASHRIMRKNPTRRTSTGIKAWPLCGKQAQMTAGGKSTWIFTCNRKRKDENIGEWKTSHITCTEWMDQGNVVHTHTLLISVSHKQEETLAVCNNTDGPWKHYTKWNQRERQILHDLSGMWNLRKTKFIETTDWRLPTARSKRWENMGEGGQK